jgi:hypothetical protein
MYLFTMFVLAQSELRFDPQSLQQVLQSNQRQNMLPILLILA